MDLTILSFEVLTMTFENPFQRIHQRRKSDRLLEMRYWAQAIALIVSSLLSFVLASQGWIVPPGVSGLSQTQHSDQCHTGGNT